MIWPFVKMDLRERLTGKYAFSPRILPILGLVSVSPFYTGVDGMAFVAALAAWLEARWARDEGGFLYRRMTTWILGTTCVALIFMFAIDADGEAKPVADLLWRFAEYWPRARWDVERLRGIPWRADLMRAQFGLAVAIAAFLCLVVLLHRKRYDEQIREMFPVLKAKGKARLVAVGHISLGTLLMLLALLARDSDRDWGAKVSTAPYPVVICVLLPFALSMIVSGVLLFRRDVEHERAHRPGENVQEEKP